MRKPLETVKIVFGDGFMTINESDFDSKIHQKYQEKSPAKKSRRKPKATDDDPTEVKSEQDAYDVLQESTGNKE